MIYLIAIVFVLALFTGPFAYKSLGAKRRKIERYEKRTGTKLSAKEKIRMMR